ncbi:amino acid-binding protein [Erwinia persicina]|uniref:amino acid-binding protein n=1 Tax=Erwinia persicina TaxID=55211 RepID=UPI00177BECE2|nr:amino acid-binding protein [Erwinia persicina]MBD8163359.1 amino acid-binding protein [Erwinia persicina]
MFDLHILLPNTPGALAALAGLLGRNGIGLEGGGVFSAGEVSHAHFLVEEGPRARQVLEAAGFQVENVCQPLIRKLPQRRPGELGEIAAALAGAGVSVFTQYSDHANQLILVTDNPAVAERVTRPWAVTAE